MKFGTTKKIILASASPRRKELLQLLGVPFDIVPSDASEELEWGHDDFSGYAYELAKRKTEAVAAKYHENVVIGADTIVVFEGNVYPKPASEGEAKQILQKLSGKTHSVITGVGIYVDGEITTFSAETKVTFRQLDEKLIDAYVESGDPMDKAGAYGIQTAGALLVEKIDGDYHTVVGLPIAMLTEQLRKLGLIVLKEGDPSGDD